MSSNRRTCSTGALRRRTRSKAPRIVRRDDGVMAWRYEGRDVINIAHAVAGRLPEEWGIEPRCVDEIRVGARTSTSGSRTWTPTACWGRCAFRRFASPARYSRKPRRDVSRPSCAPTTTGTSTSGPAPTPAGSSRLLSRCGTRAAAAEVRRVAAQGCHAVTFRQTLRPRSAEHYRDHWDPFLRPASMRTPWCCIHLGIDFGSRRSTCGKPR